MFKNTIPLTLILASVLMIGCGSGSESKKEKSSADSAISQATGSPQSKIDKVKKSHSGYDNSTMETIVNRWANSTGCKNANWKVVKDGNMDVVLFTCKIESDLTKFVEVQDHFRHLKDNIDHVDANVSFWDPDIQPPISDSPRRPGYDLIINYKKPINIVEQFGKVTPSSSQMANMEINGSTF